MKVPARCESYAAINDVTHVK